MNHSYTLAFCRKLLSWHNRTAARLFGLVFILVAAFGQIPSVAGPIVPGSDPKGSKVKLNRPKGASVQKSLLACTIPQPPQTTSCATNLVANGNFETLATSSSAFNDNVDGVDASFLSVTNGQVTGNTAAPLNWSNPTTNPPQSKTDYNGVFYLNNNGNKLIWLRNGQGSEANQCLSPIDFQNLRLKSCTRYKLRMMVAGWSPSSIVSSSNGTTSLSLEIRNSSLNFSWLRKFETIPTTSDCNQIQWKEIEYSFETDGNLQTSINYGLLLTVDDDERDGLLIDDVVLCEIGPGAACSPSDSPVCCVNALPNGSLENGDLTITELFGGYPATDISFSNFGITGPYGGADPGKWIEGPGAQEGARFVWIKARSGSPLPPGPTCIAINPGDIPCLVDGKQYEVCTWVAVYDPFSTTASARFIIENNGVVYSHPTLTTSTTATNNLTAPAWQQICASFTVNTGKVINISFDNQSASSSTMGMLFDNIVIRETSCVPPCTTPTNLSTSVSSTNPNSGATVILTANATSTTLGTTTYTWSGPGISSPAASTVASYTVAAPADPGTYTYTVVISNGTDCSATATSTLTVVPPAIAVVVGTPICNTATNIYTITGTVSLTNSPDSPLFITDNGQLAVVLSVSAGQTSASFTLTGLSGSTPPTHQIVAEVTSSTGPVVASTTFSTPASCTVCTTQISTTSLPNGQVGTAYNQTLTASGGALPYTFSVLGSLPAGLSLSSAGVISGTPTTSGSTSVSFIVTDARSCSALKPLTITNTASPVCGLNLTVTPGLCQSATNTYTLTGQVSATNVPASGTLTISSTAFSPAFSQPIPAGTSSGNFSFSGLVSNGQVYVVTASFSNTACQPVSQTYSAPVACSIAQPCSVSLAVVAGSCDPATNTYSATATLTATNVQPPRSLTLTVAGLSRVFTLTATGTSTIIYTVNNLVANGATQMVTASFEGTTCQQTSVSFAAPMACSVCSMSLSAQAGPCQPATNTYSSTVVVQITSTGPGGVLTVTDGGLSQTLAVGAGITNFSGTAIFASLPSNGTTRTITASLPGCSSMTTSYNAPISCSNEIELDKKAKIDRKEVGGTVSYTVTVVNSSTLPLTSIIVSDTYSSGISLIPSSISVSMGSYTPGLSGGDWAIASLPAGATAILTYSAEVVAEGVIYNTAYTSTTSVHTCISIPYRVCKGQAFSIKLTAPSGYNRYEWHYTAPGATTSTIVSDGTLESFTATLPGEYNVIINNGIVNSCAQAACCPIVIEEVEVPAYVATPKNPTCVGTTPQANGQITLTNLGPDPTRYLYQISQGSNFSVMQATPGSAQNVPANGIITTDLAAGTYTVRVYTLVDGQIACPRDVTLTLTANCECPEQVCVPITIQKIKVSN